jgi:predicted CoA-substrate-specific enzyme activase
MLVLGIDIGAATAKAVLFDDHKILSSAVIPTGFNVIQTASEVTEIACKESNRSMNEIAYTVSTGYARNTVPFANKQVTEITCHAKGINFLLPEARTIIDIGGQDSKVIRINETGNVINFTMNDKCAAGTGRFFEVMAGIFGLNISEMGPVAIKSTNPCKISSTCTVFAETEVVSLRAQGKSREDLIGGIHKAAVSRIMAMGKSLGYEKQVILTGGVAKNIGVKKFFEDEFKFEIIIPAEPQITGAVGAALIAETELHKQ